MSEKPVAKTACRTTTGSPFLVRSSAVDPEPITLPYPHTRNDCFMCKARDADIQLVEKPPPDPLPLLCQVCLGRYLSTLVTWQSGRTRDKPTTVTMVVAPGRRP